MVLIYDVVVHFRSWCLWKWQLGHGWNGKFEGLLELVSVCVCIVDSDIFHNRTSQFWLEMDVRYGEDWTQKGEWSAL